MDEIPIAGPTNPTDCLVRAVESILTNLDAVGCKLDPIAQRPPVTLVSTFITVGDVW